MLVIVFEGRRVLLNERRLLLLFFNTDGDSIVILSKHVRARTYITHWLSHDTRYGVPLRLPNLYLVLINVEQADLVIIVPLLSSFAGRFSLRHSLEHRLLGIAIFL